ncbi:hypothetical protein GH714_035236 [Hevea brasiliensis]|uniref:Uncharacterized protein n=1 Tax=Hevea brasiliensis TaxID=3981 RepID=A0A6A6KMW0_HEVBR|nr:hypothetical protein GH714_035236 [Hevea brasiliensis]
MLFVLVMISKIDKQDPMKFISRWHHRDTYLMSYQFSIQLVRGKSFWKCEDYGTIEPPEFKRQASRPIKKSIRSKDEPKKIPKTGSLSRNGHKVTCSICNLRGHNKKTCKNRGANGYTKQAAQPTSNYVQPSVKGKSLKDQTAQTNDQPAPAQHSPTISFHNKIQKLPVTRPNNVLTKSAKELGGNVIGNQEMSLVVDVAFMMMITLE